MTNVHQCPNCELRFRNRTELEYHRAEEHGSVPVDQQQEGLGGPRPIGRQGGDRRGA